jgi:signal transduction histidine kinase
MRNTTRAQKSIHLALLLFAFLCIIANGIVALTAVDQLGTANSKVQQALDAVQALKELDDLTAASSRYHRDYRVFGDPALLEAYRARQAAILPALQRVRGLIATDGGNPEGLDRIALLIRQDSAALAASDIAAELRSGPAGFPPELQASTARSDAIEAEINALLAEQRRTLDRPLKVIDSRNTVTLITVLIGTSAGIALVGIIFALMRRDLRNSERLAEMHSGALQQSEQRFRRIFEGSPLGILLGEPDGRITQANPAFCRMLGRSAEELVSKAIADLAHVDDKDLLIEAVLFARRQPLQPRRIDLNAYLPNHIAIARRLLGESVTICTDLSPDLWPTRADPSQVGDALLNLAINARDAMPHGGSILVRTANVHLSGGEASEVKPGDYVVLSVTDGGIGMTPELRERAVEPFFTTKAPGTGSGLGLSMIFGFAKQSGGHLEIDSAPGHGTTVKLYLPRALGQDASKAEQGEHGSLPHGQESILLVDDKPEMRAVARRHLVSLGYQVSEADCGAVALELLRARDNFDLLFTDVVMPEGMSGHQLAAAARELRPGLKVLFTTGYFQTDLDTPPCHSGDTIRKPYRRQELAAAVRAALET